ncbi:MAG: glycosyltransferase family 1 protein [Pseudanabaena sp.]|jgi:hypothetical protein
MRDLGKLKIYFYCFPPTLNGYGDYASGYHYYQHGIVCLAEGLKALGIEFYANVNFWLPSLEEPFLFRYDPHITPDDCDIVIISEVWWEAQGQFAKSLCDIQHLLRKDRPYQTILVDLSDDTPRKNFLDPQLGKLDHYFKSHLSKSTPSFPNIHPFPFGLSERIIQELKNVPLFEQRNHNLLVNSRVFLNGDHSLRKYIQTHFLPKINSIIPLESKMIADARDRGAYHALQWAQASGRHNPGYYELLLSTTVCSSFGGYFISPFPHRPWTILGRTLRKTITKLGWKTQRLVQWDSWRLWEAWAAGSVPIHLDFDKYGFILPIMPENWKHYIGIDLDDIDGSVNRISQNLDRLPEISAVGRAWALENYSPVAIAKRFLRTINID